MRQLTVILAASLGGAVVAAAGPLPQVANGAFDADTSGWTVDTGGVDTLAWSAADAAGSPHSGSARIVAEANQDAVVWSDTCVEVAAGERVVLGGSVFVENAGDDAVIRVGWAHFNDENCDPQIGWGINFSETGIAHTAPGWQTVAAGTYQSDEVRWMRPVISIAPEAVGATAYFDRIQVRPGSCVSDTRTLCLNEGRFRVTATWRDFTDGIGDGSTRTLDDVDDSGLFWFFNPGNLEVLIKVIDGCAITNHFWVFYAATTNVQFDIFVEDLVAGSTRTYSNPLGESAPAITDTAAFATCSL